MADRPWVWFYEQIPVQVPHLTNARIAELNDASDDLITRHFDKAYLQSTLDGYWRFGTVESYRPKDTALIGRFSDFREGSQYEVFQSRTGAFRSFKGGRIDIGDCVFVGGHPAVGIEYTSNDYCSCSSRGGFRQDRAIMLRNRGNPEIGAYAVYDARKLKKRLSRSSTTTKTRTFANCASSRKTSFMELKIGIG